MNSGVLSALNVHHIIVDKLSFDRKGFKNEANKDIDFQIGVSINKLQDSNYQVAVRVTAEKRDEYVAEVQMTAYCEISEECQGKDTLLRKNAVAILFPYIRSQLTLLTSQPEIEPIVLPTLDINRLIDSAEKKDNND